MEHHSQTNDTSDSRSILEGQLRECFGRVVYSHETHEKCADILLSRLSQIKLWQIILSAVTTGSFIAAVRSRKAEDNNANAEVAHRVCALIHLGDIAYRNKTVLTFDPQTEKIVNQPKLNIYLKKEYRAPYELPLKV